VKFRLPLVNKNRKDITFYKDENNKNIMLASSLSARSFRRRIDFAEENHSLQMAIIPLKNGENIRAHIHNPQRRETNFTEEIWILIRGSALATIYNLDGSMNSTLRLESGHILHLYQGGHSLTPMGRKTLLYEIKNGPYTGSVNDRTYLE